MDRQRFRLTTAVKKASLESSPLIIWTGKQFVADRRSERRRPGSFNDRYIGMVCRVTRGEMRVA